MRRRVIAAAGVLAVAISAIAWADGLPPHSSYYAQHHHYTGKGANISFVVHRKSHTADIYASDNCLGQQSGYTNEATVRGAHVRKHALHYDGNAIVYGSMGSTTVKMKVSAKVTHKKVKGTVSFPNTTGCSSRSFTATLVSSTK